MERSSARPTRHRYSGDRPKKSRTRVNLGEIRAHSGPEGRHQKSRARQAASIPGLPPRRVHTKGARARVKVSRRAIRLIGLAVLGSVIAVVVVAASTLGRDTGPTGEPTASPPVSAQVVAGAQDRVAVGQALSKSGRIEANGPVQDLFTAGKVDPRILATLAVLIQRGPVQVRDLPAMDDGDAADQPRRQLLLDVPATEVESVRQFFLAQQGPYLPAAVTAVPTGVQVVYPPNAPPELLQGLAGS